MTTKRLHPESLIVVRFDDDEIVVTFPSGSTQKVAWKDITKVGVRTTDDGPFHPDVFWGIHAGSEQPAVVFPGGATGETELLAELQRRMAGFRDDEVIKAMGSTSNAFFVIWSS